MNQYQYIQSNLFPKWVANRCILIYFAALAISAVLFGHILPWYFLLPSSVWVILFFTQASILGKRWGVDRVHSGRSYERKLFIFALLLRIVAMTTLYFIFMNEYGDAFGYELADPTFYDELGNVVAEAMRKGNYNALAVLDEYGAGRVDVSDMGYGIWLGLLYFLTDNSILIARIIKCILSAYTVVLVYRLASRNFGEQTGRLAAIFCLLWPNFWYYCGTHAKEVEMVFLCVLFVEQADQMLRTRNFSVWKIIPILLLDAAMFTIRTPLALVMLLALLFTIVMSSSRVVSWGKRVMVGSLAVVLIAITMGNRIQEQTQQLLDSRGDQQTSMEWRTKRANGNQFAKYAGTAVFAPLIFTIPFPTMADIPEQYTQKVNLGGNFIKNILSGFLVLCLLMLLFSGEWRNYALPLSLMLGYLLVLSVSSFAQSERFHQPAVPFELMFIALGLSKVLRGEPVFKGKGRLSTYKNWFSIWSFFILLACVGWQWFKLKGRGMI